MRRDYHHSSARRGFCFQLRDSSRVPTEQERQRFDLAGLQQAPQPTLSAPIGPSCSDFVVIGEL